MSIYIRPRVAGGTVFFTVALADRSSDLLVKDIGALRMAVRQTGKERPFESLAWVILPDHLHTIWRLPRGDHDFSTRWGAIKARFTRAVMGKPGFSPAPDLPVVQSGRYAGLKPGLREHKRERPIWQRRFWEHHIRNDEDLAAHMRYCWLNPVKHGLVKRPEDWPYSSFIRQAERMRASHCDG